MRKSTKIITTAVALALVVAAMVVGIYAATAGSASITANVSWTATEGIQFRIEAYTVGSKEHQTYLTSQGKTFADFDTLDIFNFHGGEGGITNPQEIADVDTSTTNATAEDISGTINATFVDTSDDGVNNPRDIYYVYYIENTDYINGLMTNGTKTTLVVDVEKVPTSTANVEVTYWAGIVSGESYCRPSSWETKSTTTAPTQITMTKGNLTEAQCCLIIRLHLLTPDQNLTNFDASVELSFSKGA